MSLKKSATYEFEPVAVEDAGVEDLREEAGDWCDADRGELVARWRSGCGGLGWAGGEADPAHGVVELREIGVFRQSWLEKERQSVRGSAVRQEAGTRTS